MLLIFLPMFCRIAFRWSKSWRIGSAGIKTDPWAWLPLLSFRHTTPWWSCRETEVPYSKSLNTEAVDRRSLSGVQVFRTFPSLSFFAPNRPVLQATPFYWVFIQEAEFLPIVSNAASQERTQALFPLQQLHNIHCHLITLHTHRHLLCSELHLNVRKESQASFAAGKAQDIISCTMSGDVQ